MKKYSPIVLRIGLSIVFLWFGFSQLSNPNLWVSMLPDWTTSVPISQTAFIWLNGWFEVTFGLMLLIGFYTRFVSLMLALHLLEITCTVGYGAIGVRDLGLSIATLSIFLQGISEYSLDNYFTQKELDTNKA